MSTENATRKWHVKFHDGPPTEVSAHQYHVTENGEVNFTIDKADGTKFVCCTLSRGSWQHVRHVPTPGS